MINIAWSEDGESSENIENNNLVDLSGIPEEELRHIQSIEKFRELIEENDLEGVIEFVQTEEGYNASNRSLAGIPALASVRVDDPSMLESLLTWRGSDGKRFHNSGHWIATRLAQSARARNVEEKLRIIQDHASYYSDNIHGSSRYTLEAAKVCNFGFVEAAYNVYRAETNPSTLNIYGHLRENPYDQANVAGPAFFNCLIRRIQISSNPNLQNRLSSKELYRKFDQYAKLVGPFNHEDSVGRNLISFLIDSSQLLRKIFLEIEKIPDGKTEWEYILEKEQVQAQYARELTISFLERAEFENYNWNEQDSFGATTRTLAESFGFSEVAKKLESQGARSAVEIVEFNYGHTRKVDIASFAQMSENSGPLTTKEFKMIPSCQFSPNAKSSVFVVNLREGIRSEIKFYHTSEVDAERSYNFECARYFGQFRNPELFGWESKNMLQSDFQFVVSPHANVSKDWVNEFRNAESINISPAEKDRFGALRRSVWRRQ